MAYPTRFERAAFALRGLVTGHPFVQDNKWIAFLLAALAHHHIYRFSLPSLIHQVQRL